MRVLEEDNNSSSNNELHPHRYMAVHTHTCNHQRGKEMCKLVNAMHLLKIVMPLCWFHSISFSYACTLSIYPFFFSYICFPKWCLHLYCVYFGVLVLRKYLLTLYIKIHCLYFHLFFKWLAWVFQLFILFIKFSTFHSWIFLFHMNVGYCSGFFQPCHFHVH